MGFNLLTECQLVLVLTSYSSASCDFNVPHFCAQVVDLKTKKCILNELKYSVFSECLTSVFQSLWIWILSGL